MLADLASQIKIGQTHSPVTNPCNPLAFEQPLIAQCSSINNWEHTYVGWMVVG